MEKSLTYEEAYEELNRIYVQISNEEVSIDELTEKVKRAAFLVAFCQEKLRSTEEEINKIVSSMPEPPAAGDGG